MLHVTTCNRLHLAVSCRLARMKIRETTFKLSIFIKKMNIFSILIVCAAVVGFQAIEDEPKINFGACSSDFSKFDASGILSYFNDPENADLKEFLRFSRDINKVYAFDEQETLNAVKRIFGKSEMNYLITGIVIARRELNREIAQCIFNKILGENETRAFDIHDEGFIEVIGKLRVRVENFKFDEEKSRPFIEFFLGKSEVGMFNHLSELFKIGLEMIKPWLLDFFNLILGDKNQGSVLQDADFKKLLRKLRDVIQNYKIDVDKIREFFEEDLEFEENELTEVLSELVKIKADIIKHNLVDNINRNLGDKETEFHYAYQQAEFEKPLRKLRDMLHNFIFDEDEIHDFVKSVLELETSEVTHRMSQMITITLEMLKQYINDFINRYLGEIEAPGAFSQTVDLQKLGLLRYKILIHDFDEGMYFRDFILRYMEHIELADFFYNMLKMNGESGRQSLLNFVDKILKGREVQGTFSEQEVDFYAFRLRRRLEKLISIMAYILTGTENNEEKQLLIKPILKKALASYEKLLLLGYDLNARLKMFFHNLLTFDRLRVAEFSAHLSRL